MAGPSLPTLFAVARSGTAVVGVGQLVVERGWGGVQCMATVAEHKGRGVASAVLNQLAGEALQHSASRMYLAVMADNAPAQAVYRRSGFATTHEYRYFTS